MVTSLLSDDDLRQACDLIEQNGLLFDPPFDDLVGIFEARRLTAVGARDGRILKMLAVAPGEQGGNLLEQIVAELISHGHREGHDSFFVFASPAEVPSFEALDFRLLASAGQSALLEYGDGLRRYLNRHRHQIVPGNNGAIVVNCNPFTRGHRFLVEQAASRVDRLYLFVVREEGSLFPFEYRFRMVKDGTSDLANVVVLDTSCYAISSITFPTYFLKDGDPGGATQMELDLKLFATRIAPHFQVKTRFVGSEPLSRTTARYNEAMHRVLPAYGVAVTQFERIPSSEAPISASRVRQLLALGATEELAALVPASTLNVLLLPEVRRIWETREQKIA